MGVFGPWRVVRIFSELIVESGIFSIFIMEYSKIHDPDFDSVTLIPIANLWKEPQSKFFFLDSPDSLRRSYRRSTQSAASPTAYWASSRR